LVEALKKLASRRVDGLEKLSDEVIVKMAQEELPHDLTAYREILRRYEGLVYNTCYKVIGNAEDAQEVSQDALIQVFHKLNQFEGRSAFKTWLYKVVHNYCRNRLSKIIRRREGKEAYEGEMITTEADPAANADKHDLSEKVQEALNKLKDKDREVIVLKFMSGLTLQEIAEVLDLGLSASKMRLYRALEAFKGVYAHTDNEIPAKFTL